MVERVEGPVGWTVLLIGGNSATGKSTVAREISLRLGIPWYMVDDFRLTLARACGAKHLPILRAFDNLEAVAGRTLATLIRERIEVARVTSSAIEVVIDSHAGQALPVILEGDDITPELAALPAFAGGPPRAPGVVRSVFIIEDDATVIEAAMRRRARHFVTLSSVSQAHLVELSLGYGHWLADEALRLRLPVVPARPWETLADRVLAAV